MMRVKKNGGGDKFKLRKSQLIFGGNKINKKSAN